MRLSVLFALFTFAACKGTTTQPTEADTDTDTDTDADTDTDTDADTDLTSDEDLGQAVGAAVASGSTCGAGDDEGFCGTGEDMVYAWSAPYDGFFRFAAEGFEVGVVSDAEADCSNDAKQIWVPSGGTVEVLVEAETCGDYTLDIDPTPTAAASGTVRDAAGDPVEGAQIRFCAEVCLNASTDAAGMWSVERAEATNTSLEVLTPGGGTTATSFTVVELQSGTTPTYEMALLELDAASTLGATAWHTIGDGLRVEVADGEVEPPDAFFPEVHEVAGVQVPQASWPPLEGLDDVIAVWFTAPFDYHVTGGAPIEIDNQWSLPAGETYRVWVGSYGARAWVDAGTLTADATTLTGPARIDLFSTIVLTGPVTP